MKRFIRWFLKKKIRRLACKWCDWAPWNQVPQCPVCHGRKTVDIGPNQQELLAESCSDYFFFGLFWPLVVMFLISVALIDLGLEGLFYMLFLFIFPTCLALLHAFFFQEDRHRIAQGLDANSGAGLSFKEWWFLGRLHVRDGRLSTKTILAFEEALKINFNSQLAQIVFEYKNPKCSRRNNDKKESQREKN